MWIAIQVRQDALHHGGDELLVGEAQSTKERLEVRNWPKIIDGTRQGSSVAQIERAATEDPTLHQVGMDVACLLQRKVTLVHRAMAFSAKTQFLLKRWLCE